MPPYKAKKHRLCPCGCQQPVPLLYSSGGRFKGYSRGVPGHRRAKTDQQWRAFRIAMLDQHRPRVPIGTTRLHRVRGLTYRKIKVTPTGRWLYEHRVVMAQRLGRALAPREHVHHVNHDTLDNRPENLALVSHAAHMQIHKGLTAGQWSIRYAACVVCGETTRRHASRGRCTRCNQRRT